MESFLIQLKLASNRMGDCTSATRNYQYNQSTGTSRANKWNKGFQSGLKSNHMYIWFYMVVGK